MAYLNHAGTSWPKPECVRQAAAQALSSDPAQWAAHMERDHAAVAKAFGVSPDRLLLTPGCTSALSVAIADHPWASGDRVLISGLEHHALQRPLLKLAEFGVELVVLPRDTQGPLSLDVLEEELNGGGVRLVAMTAACNVTGECLPIEAVARLAHEHGALCLIDGAQIAGWMPIEPLALGIDLFTFAGHKGPQAPWGIGGLIVAPDVLMSSPAAACELPQAGRVAACSSLPGYCDVGSVDRAALAGLAAGLEWLEAPERVHRLEHARRLALRLSEELAELPGLRLHGAGSLTTRLPTVAVTVQEKRPSDLASALQELGIIASGGLQCAPLAHETLGTAPDGVLRFSFGPTSGEDDVAATIQGMREVLARNHER